MEPCTGAADFSDPTLRSSLSVVAFDDDANDVPLVRRDETRDVVVVVGGMRRSGNLLRLGTLCHTNQDFDRF